MTMSIAAALSALALGALPPGAPTQGAGAAPPDALRVVVRDDASVSVVAGDVALVRSMALVLSSAEEMRGRLAGGAGEPHPLPRRSSPRGVPVVPARAWRPAKAHVAGRTYVLATAEREAGGGTIVEFSATPEAARDVSPWEELEPVGASLVARIASESFQGGLVSVDGDERPFGEGAAYAGAKAVRLVARDGPGLVIESESPGPIELAQQGAVLVLRMHATLFDAGSPVELAVFVGRKPYEGPPILLARPSVRAAEGLDCIELAVRAFGGWRDPFDSADASLRLRTKDSRHPSAGASGSGVRISPPKLEPRGYFAQDYAPADARTEAASAALEPRGFPGFRARLPYSSAGTSWVLSFATGSGRAESALAPSLFRALAAPSVGPRELRSGASALAGASLPPGLGLAEAARRLRELSTAALRLVRVPVYEGELSLVQVSRTGQSQDLAFGDSAGEGPPRIRLDAAWRIDRLLAEAQARGVALVLVLASGLPGDTGEGPPDRAAEAGLARLLLYADARWGTSPSLAGLELVDPSPAGEGSVERLLERIARSAGPLSCPLSVLLSDAAKAREGRLGAWDIGATLKLPGLGRRGGESSPIPRDPARAAFDAAFASRAAYVVLDLPGLPPGKAGSENAELLRERHRVLWAAAVGTGARIFTGARVGTGEAAEVVRFASPQDAPACPPMPEALVIEEEDWRLLGRRGDRGAVWWMERRPASGGSASVRGASFELSSLEPGRYLLEWWQPYEGSALTRLELRVPAGDPSRPGPGGRVLVAAPTFAHELAGRLVRLGGFGAE